MTALFIAWCYCLSRSVHYKTPPPSGGIAASFDDEILPVELPDKPVTEAPTLLIDPGHGGSDPGTIAHDSYEKTWTLPLALGLAAELQKRGWPVELTRETDTTLTLTDRSRIANSKPRLAFVSIHLNSGPRDAQGAEIYYAWPKAEEVMARLHDANRLKTDETLIDDRGQRLAESVMQSLATTTGCKNRGFVNNPTLSVTRRTLCPAIIAEVGFLTHPEESQLFATKEYRQKVITGLADGIEHWLLSSQNGPPTTPTTPPSLRK